MTAEAEEVTRGKALVAEKDQPDEGLCRERDLLKKILDSMEEGVYVVNQQFEIQYLNPVVEREFGPVGGRKCHEYFHNFSLACSWCEKTKDMACTAVRREWNSSKTSKTYELFVTPIPGENGALCRLGIFHDITEYRKVEDDLRRSESRYRTLVETMTDGLLIQDETGRVVYMNDRGCEILGYTRDEIVGRPVVDFLDPAGLQVYREQMVRRRRGEAESYELSLLRKDGKKVIVLVSPRPILDEKGQFKGSFGVFTDITERKRMEMSLRESEKQIRLLSIKLLNSQEAERKRISKELHDELGQALAVLKLSLNFVGNQLLPGQADLRRECRESVRYIDETIENVRRLSQDLSPSILEEIGLSAALHKLFHHFRNSFEVHVLREISNLDRLFSSQARILIYRIFQEVLTNIMKHARARNVFVGMAREGGGISFEIEDDGKGFNLDKNPGRDGEWKGMGLSTMTARARMLEGVLEVESQEGKGTRLRLSIPLLKEGGLE
jgi:PAS domain S-box-containing protein